MWGALPSAVCTVAAVDQAAGVCALWRHHPGLCAVPHLHFGEYETQANRWTGHFIVLIVTRVSVSFVCSLILASPCYIRHFSHHSALWILGSIPVSVYFPCVSQNLHGMDGFTIAWLIGGIFVFMAIPITLWEIVQHLINYTKPKLQKHIIRWVAPHHSWLWLPHRIFHLCSNILEWK